MKGFHYFPLTLFRATGQPSQASSFALLCAIQTAASCWQFLDRLCGCTVRWSRSDLGSQKRPAVLYRRQRCSDWRRTRPQSITREPENQSVEPMNKRKQYRLYKYEQVNNLTMYFRENWKWSGQKAWVIYLPYSLYSTHLYILFFCGPEQRCVLVLVDLVWIGFRSQ